MIESNATMPQFRPTGSLAGGVDEYILAEVIAASSDACWCMDFGTPVDLTAPDHEVVRQVFENDPFWRFANPAMAQLYLLPAGETLVHRPVREIFPRNRQNEDFVLNLLANGFEVDAAPALDQRYDGVEIYVENDVRAHVENGRLLRMFGIVRDVGKNRRREMDLERRLDAALALLSVVDAPLIALGAEGRIEALNLTAAARLGRPMEECLGQALGDLGADAAAWAVSPRSGDGAILTRDGAS